MKPQCIGQRIRLGGAKARKKGEIQGGRSFFREKEGKEGGQSRP